MSGQSLNNNVDEAEVCLRLREDLVFSPLPDRNGSWIYQIEDLSRSKFFRVGLSEYTFISLLDGQTTVKEAWQLYQTTPGLTSLTENETLAIARWLVRSGLVTVKSDDCSHNSYKQISENNFEANKRWHPLFFRIPIGSPDRIIRLMLPWLKWVHSPIAITLWCILLFLAAYHVICQWSKFSNESIGIFAPGNIPWLISIWLILKIIHEFSHALACRKYGGRVGKMGVMMVFFAPLAFVDVTSSWRFPSRWQRIHVAFAGVYLELGIAAFAAILWFYSDSELICHRLYSVILVGGFSSILFNANPLMRADGYYILADTCGIPNLHMAANEQLKSIVAKIFGNSSASKSSFTLSARILLGLYGAAVWCWRLSIYACFVIGAATLFHGAGIIISCVAGFLLCWPILTGFIQKLRANSDIQPKPGLFLRPGYLVTGVFLVVTLIATNFTWKERCVAPGVVRYASNMTVRTQVPGFLTKLFVNENSRVKQGQLLAVLRNDELTAELDTLCLNVEEVRLKCQLLLRKHKNSELRIEMEKLEGLEQQLREKTAVLKSLRIYAPFDGRIVSRTLDAKTGKYFEQGTNLLTIEGYDSPEFRISVSQRDVRELSQLHGHDLDIRIAGAGRMIGALERIEPRGSENLTIPELSAANGGPLPVTVVATSPDDQSSREYRLLSPRFDAVIKLKQVPSQVYSGQIGAAAWYGGRSALTDRLALKFQTWIQDRTGQK